MPVVDSDFDVYARGVWPRLVATARLLTEDSRAGEELARRTLVRVCARWRRIPRNDVDFHVRRCLVRGYLRTHRIGGRRRAVLVLRHWSGLGEPEIAQVLGCSVGAVRALLRRGAKNVPPEARQARFAALMSGFVPSAVPLDDIRRDGALRRRRRAGVVAAGCALLLAPPAVLTSGSLTGGDTTGAAEAPDQPAPGPVRIVAPGERVAAAPGVDVWLTPDGHHWSSAQAPTRFRPVSDGNLDHGRPGISVQGERLDDETYFQTGVYYGLDGEAARIEIRTGGRTVTANVLTLAGSPGWGVWYAKTPVGEGGSGGGSRQVVTVYDASGDVLVRSELGPAVGRAVPVGSVPEGRAPGQSGPGETVPAGVWRL
ncbi:sigma factor-like helix-turn-helix DNA-binding protein [Streptomyces sp. NPDC052079]|uniref:sigma factor-like helix-turn-helix DNA-binding protein n=1 Tax=Streptomyces sp. NPDC052079 TaxID=3155526 RepID=UPI0034146E4C